MLDWKSFRPYKKLVIVKEDPRSIKTAGGIIKTDALWGVERVSLGTGTVLKVGSEVRKVAGPEIEPGVRVFYRGFLKEVFQEFGKEDDCVIFMLRAEDILGTVDCNIKMGEL